MHENTSLNDIIKEMCTYIEHQLELSRLQVLTILKINYAYTEITF